MEREPLRACDSCWRMQEINEAAKRLLIIGHSVRDDLETVLEIAQDLQELLRLSAGRLAEMSDKFSDYKRSGTLTRKP